MFYALLLLFVCTILAYWSSNKQSVTIEKTEKGFSQSAISLSSIAFIALLIILVCFGGLRTFMNDTAIYLSSFEEKVPNTLSGIKSVDWAIGSNPLFAIYRIIIKSLLTTNGQVFIFVSSLITITSMILFIRKNSENFGFSIFLFISFTVYAFTLGAMKQTMATAIAIWAVPLFLSGKKIRAVLLIVIAMFIHPYVVVYFAFFFLYKNIWDKRAVLIILATLAISFVFTSFIAGLLNLTSLIGDEYDSSMFEGTGTNIFRVLVYWVTPVLSFVYREQIREKDNKFLNVCINLSLVSACFILLASIGGANMMGRLANYFDIFTCISLPVVVSCGNSKTNEKTIISLLAFIGFIGFYITYYSKYYPNFFGDMFNDYYCHVSFMELFKG